MDLCVENVDNVHNFEDNIICNLKNSGFTGKLRYLLDFAVELCQVSYAQKNPHARHVWNVHKHVDNVDNYFPRRCSPIFTTSPAPIVINRSPCAQLFKR